MRQVASTVAEAAPLRSRTGRAVVDVTAVLAVLAPGILPLEVGQTALQSVAAGASVVAAIGVLPFRRRSPRAAAGAALVVTVIGMAVGGPVGAYLALVLITVFTVAAATDRWTTVVAGALAASVVGAASAIFLPSRWADIGDVIQLVGLVGFAAAAGDASRSRRAFIAAVTERARRAEESKESEARRRVAEERLTIARDLHDVVAHQIAVINMNANVASQILAATPEHEAEQSLATIRHASRAVLADIASLLTMLRHTNAGGGDHPAHLLGLAQLDQLVAEFRRNGLDLDLRTVGDPVPLPPSVDVAAYRVVQEGLTNAHKHGADSSALLQIEYRADALAITITNTTRSSVHQVGAPRPGHGLTGVQERVAAVAGTVVASYGPGPVHRLTTQFPHQPEAALDQERRVAVRPGRG